MICVECDEHIEVEGCVISEDGIFVIHKHCYTKMQDALSPIGYVKLLKRIEELEHRLATPDPMMEVPVGKTPHRCPVCDGKMHVVNKTYPDMAQKCLVCNGKGIVWG